MPEISTIAGYQLLHDGVLAMADIEANGIHIDTEYVRRQQVHLTRRIEHLSEKMESHEEMKIWKKAYRHNLNMDSTEQLSDILFKQMEHEAVIMTKGKKPKPSVSEEALEQSGAGDD